MYFLVRVVTLLVLTTALVAFASPLVQAQVAPLEAGDCGTVGIKCSNADNSGTLRTYILGVINIALGLVGLIAFIFVLLGGVRYIASRGDEGEAEAAKKTILYAVIGIIIVGLAAIVVNFTLKAAGVGGELPGGSDLQGTLLTILNIFLGLLGITALVFVLLGGVRYITSQGDESKAEEGKKTILYAVIGIVIVGLAAILVNFTLGAAGLESTLPGGSNLRGSLLIIINVFLGLIGVTALVFVLLGGVRYITSQGDESKAEEGKKTILYAVIGVVLVGMAAIVVNFAGQAAGLPTGLPGTDNLPGALLLVINFFLGLVGVTALAFVLVGAIRYITSQGDESKAEEAKKTILYAVIGIIVVGMAAVVVNFTAAAVDLPTGLTASNDLPGAILYVINIFLILAALTALIFIIYAGVQYITSRGDSDKAENAKLTILYAVIGLIVIGLAAVLVNFIISAFLSAWW